MLDRLAAAWSTYWTRPYFLFIAGMMAFTSLVSAGMLSGQSLFRADNPGLPAPSMLLFSVMFVIAFPGIAVFMQLVLQFQFSFALLLPRYAPSHLLAAGALLSFMWFATALLTVLAGAPWPLTVVAASTLVSATFATCRAFPRTIPIWLLWCLMILCYGPALALIVALLSPAIGPRGVADAMQPWHAGLSLIQLGFLAGLAAQFLPESSRFFAEGGGNALPMWGAGFDIPFEKALNSDSAQAQSKCIKPLVASLRDSDLAAYHGQRWFRRLRLWQAGGSPGPLRMFSFGLFLQVMFFVIMVGTNGRNTSQAGFIVMQTCMTLSIIVLQSARGRQLRFGVEWLRPVSRQTAVGDLLRGIAFDLLAIPLVSVAAAVWVTSIDRINWTGQHWVCLLAAASGAYVLSVGLVSTLSLVRSNLSLLPAVGLMFLPSIPCMWIFLPPPRDLSQSSFLMMAAIVGLSLIVPGVVLIAIARRKWLDRELA